MKFLLNEDGESYIDVFIKLFITMALLFMLVNLPGPIKEYQNLMYVCRSVTRAIETNGEVDGSINGLISDLCNATKIEPSIRYEGFTRASGTMRVQLREKFTVTMETTYKIKMFNMAFGEPTTIDIPLRVTSNGVGEVYFK